MAQDGSEFVRMVKNDAEWLRLAQNSNSAEWLNIVAPDWFRTDSLTGFVDPSCSRLERGLRVLFVCSRNL